MLQSPVLFVLVIIAGFGTSIGNAGIADKECNTDADCPEETSSLFGVKVKYKCGKEKKQFYKFVYNKKTKKTDPKPKKDPDRLYKVCECQEVDGKKATLMYFPYMDLKNDSTGKDCGIAGGQQCLPATSTKISRGCASLQCRTDLKPEVCEGVSGEFKPKSSSSQTSVSNLIFGVLALIVSLIQRLLLQWNQ